MPIPTLMRRLLATSLLTLVAVAALAASAMAATPRPVVTAFSPAQPRVGTVLVLTGKNFAKGATHNRVYFRRASDGKTVRTRPKTATTRRITVVIPAKVEDFLTVGADGSKQPTRFEIGIFTTVFGPFTRASRSPLILPAAAPGTPPPTGPGTTPAPPPCVPSTDPSVDTDGDLIPDVTEAQIKTDPCKKDTDGDGVEDGYEYYSALDLNGNDKP